jgi:hypothetical protein
MAIGLSFKQCYGSGYARSVINWPPRIRFRICHLFEKHTVPVPSNRVISSLEGKFGIVGKLFVLVVEHLFMKISNLCKNHL